MTSLPCVVHRARQEKTKRTSGQCLRAIIKSLNPTLRGWFEYFKHSWCPSENYPLFRTASRTLVMLSIASILLCRVSRILLEFN
ncbi:MAG: group II intron maturase-specific domain-containing protein [Isosphaeraceae bacterium]